MTKIKAVQHLRQILKAECEEPSEAIIAKGKAIAAEGQALQKIGETLRGMSLSEARGVVGAVAALEGIE